ncbi:MAG: type II toxin-antitoxin system YafQ family toxin [Pseudomonadota bacterium]
MRTIKHTSKFKRDYKRELKSGAYKKTLDKELIKVVSMLTQDIVLSKRYYDHFLIGEWKDHRDCHIKPDLILIYRKPDRNSLELVRLGSHSKLSL